MENVEKRTIRTTLDGYGRFTQEEMRAIKASFKSNDFLLKVLRKVFLPNVKDSVEEGVPIGQVVDTYVGIAVEGKTDAEIAGAVRARNEVIRHIEAQLMQLKLLADVPEESQTERVERMKKDSLK